MIRFAVDDGCGAERWYEYRGKEELKNKWLSDSPDAEVPADGVTVLRIEIDGTDVTEKVTEATFARIGTDEVWFEDLREYLDIEATQEIPDKDRKYIDRERELDIISAIEIMGYDRTPFERYEVGQVIRKAVTLLRTLEPREKLKPHSRIAWGKNVVVCPSCRKYLFDMEQPEWTRNFCGCCGQPIDWTERAETLK